MRKLQNMLYALAAMFFAMPVFADGGSAPVNLAPIGIGLGIGIAAGLCGIGQGRAVGSTSEALARNPGTRNNLMTSWSLAWRSLSHSRCSRSRWSSWFTSRPSGKLIFNL